MLVFRLNEAYMLLQLSDLCFEYEDFGLLTLVLLNAFFQMFVQDLVFIPLYLNVGF